GQFAAAAGKPTVFELRRNPLCAGEHAEAPLCVWHAAVFRRLFQALVSPRATVQESACAACGAGACRFEADW
ncbi:MAG: bacteriochlorophyll 4-vinyl reductase, partial [Proteobacteria bacterium]|nr:bacteriochlorophyll 4-vinyl reductase [Pseudomonadota bacterium]